MAATILENGEFDEPVLQEGEELSSFDEQEPVESVNPEPEEVEVVEEEELPEKYKGKSMKDIVRMHQEAEKLVGKQGSEVGDLRKVVDDFIRTNLDNKPTAVQEPVEEIDFFDKPQEAINQTISANSDIQEIKQMKKELEKREAITRLNSAHPDFMQTATTPEFQSWVQASKVRTELLQRADSLYDFDAADELLSNWKEKSINNQKAKEVVEKDRGQQRKAASSGSAKGTGEGKQKPVYKRSDIIKLMQTNPNRYAELADEITIAYSEGRVR